MRVAIVGSRDYTDYETFSEHVKKADLPIKVVVSGGALGVDALAKRYAEEHGLEYKEFPADWKTYGKSAGPERNAQIVADTSAMIAFPAKDSKGTRNSIKMAMKKYPLAVVVYELADIAASKKNEYIPQVKKRRKWAEMEQFEATALLQTTARDKTLNQWLQHSRDLRAAAHPDASAKIKARVHVPTDLTSGNVIELTKRCDALFRDSDQRLAYSNMSLLSRMGAILEEDHVSPEQKLDMLTQAWQHERDATSSLVSNMDREKRDILLYDWNEALPKKLDTAKVHSQGYEEHERKRKRVADAYRFESRPQHSTCTKCRTDFGMRELRVKGKCKCPHWFHPHCLMDAWTESDTPGVQTCPVASCSKEIASLVFLDK